MIMRGITSKDSKSIDEPTKVYQSGAAQIEGHSDSYRTLGVGSMQRPKSTLPQSMKMRKSNNSGMGEDSRSQSSFA